ncbi:MAG: type II secretion system secretin GspD [Dongiaceae bacterium]
MLSACESFENVRDRTDIETYRDRVAGAKERAPSKIETEGLGGVGAPASAEIGDINTAETPDQSQALSKPEVYRGAGVFAAPVPSQSQVSVGDSGDVTFNFVNAEIRDVVDAILGQSLKIGYIIDPRVQGTVTVRTARPLTPTAAIAVLEEVLASNGAAMQKAGDVYKIAPIEGANAGAQTIYGTSRGYEPGFGTHVIPLRHTSAASLRDVLEPFLPPGRALRVDPARNLLIFAGTGTEAQDLEDLIATFDVDWMSGMSYALYPLEFADSVKLTSELEQVFLQNEQSPLAGLVNFIPIERLNAILVITAQPAAIDQAQAWINRLDRGEEGVGRRLYVYYVQNSRAEELADILGQVFQVQTSSGAAGGIGDVAPGLTPVELQRQEGAGYGSAFQRTTGGASELAQSPSDTAGQETPPDARGITAAGESLLSPTLTAVSDIGGALPGSDTGVRIVADLRHNALVISATPTEFRMIQSTLNKLDIVPLQVLLEATIAEVSLNDDLEYGLQWFFSSGDSTVSSLPAGLAPFIPGAGFTYLLESSNVRVRLRALTEITDVKVISSPNLFVLDNERARLQVGDQVPIAVSSTVDVNDGDNSNTEANEIEYRDTGVILDIIPRVNASGLIVLDIIQEVSDVVETDTSEIDSPTIRQRKIESTVAIHSGDSVVLGGLIRDSDTRDISGIPLVSEIPILGNLFKSTSSKIFRTELLVLITPRIVRDRVDAQTVTEELRKRLRSLEQIEQKIY